MADHCHYAGERVVSNLDAISPYECPKENINSVLREIVGYFAIRMRRYTEKFADLNKAEERARKINRANCQPCRDEARLAFDPRPANAKDQLKTLVKTLRPAMKAEGAFEEP